MENGSTGFGFPGEKSRCSLAPRRVVASRNAGTNGKRGRPQSRSFCPVHAHPDPIAGRLPASGAKKIRAQAPISVLHRAISKYWAPFSATSPKPKSGRSRGSSAGAAHGRPRARAPDVVGSRLPRPYHFRARIQSYQAVAAPFPGDSALPSSPLGPRSHDRNAPFKRLSSGSRVGILFPFGSSRAFAFAGRMISNPAATRSPLPCAPRRAVASPHARERAPSRETGRRDLNAVIVVHASAPRPAS